MKFTLSFLALLLSGQFLFAQFYNFPTGYTSYVFPAGGNVGIGTGTTAVPYPLTVYSTTSNLAQFKTTTATNSAISIVNASGQMNLGIGASTPHPYVWSNTGNLMIGNDGGPTVFVKGMGNGSVGINTITPGWPLDVNGMIHTNSEFWVDQANANTAGVWIRGAASTAASLVLQGGSSAWQDWWITGNNGVLQIGANGSTLQGTGVLNIDFNGNSAFGGSTASNYKLDVYGNLRANEVVVNTTGADYVFDTAYKLPSLQTVDAYIRAHHHLPDVAPAGQMQQQGMPVGENQTVLLKKIEELTLYIIEQDKKMAKMQSELDELKASH